MFQFISRYRVSRVSGGITFDNSVSTPDHVFSARVLARWLRSLFFFARKKWSGDTRSIYFYSNCNDGLDSWSGTLLYLLSYLLISSSNSVLIDRILKSRNPFFFFFSDYLKNVQRNYLRLALVGGKSSKHNKNFDFRARTRATIHTHTHLARFDYAGIYVSRYREPSSSSQTDGRPSGDLFVGGE